MTVPRRPGRAQPRAGRGRPYLQTVHAFAAYQAVLAPLCRRRAVAFPPRPETAAAARALWWHRLRQLRARGWGPLASGHAMGRAYRCPWRLLGLADADPDAPPCHLPACPSCHGLRAALLVEAALRVRAADPGAELRLVREHHDVPERDLARFLDAALAPPDDRAAGYALQVAVERAGAEGYVVRRGALTVNGVRGNVVPRSPLAVANAVAWAAPYPAENILGAGDPDAAGLAGLLGRLAGRKLSARRGPFRSALAAERLDQCRVVIAPALDPTAPTAAGDASDLGVEMTDDDITWAMTVPDPADGWATRQRRLTDLLAAHLLDPADPETGELEIPLPPDLCDYDEDEAEDDLGGVLCVPQSEAADFWEAVHEEQLEAELQKEREPEAVVVDGREHRVIAGALDTLRPAAPESLFGGQSRRTKASRAARGASPYRARDNNPPV